MSCLLPMKLNQLLLAAIALTASRLAFAAMGFAGTWGPYTPADLTFSAADISSTKSNCVIFSNGKDKKRRDYQVTASQDTTGVFELGNGSGDNLRIRLYYSDDNNATEIEMTDGVELGTAFTGNTTAQCGGGGAVNAHLRVEVLLSDYAVNSVPAGNYSGTVTMTIRRGGQTQFTTVNLSINVSNLVRITDLDDYSFDVTGWSGGSLTSINAFCVFTNATGGTIDITATTNAYYHHNGNPARFGVRDTAPGGTTTRRYNVRIREVGGSWIGGNYTVGETNTLSTSGANLTCGNTGENMQMRVRFGAGQINSAVAGVYLGVLELIVSPN